MATTRHYADTVVPVSRSRDELERLLLAHKVKATRWTTTADTIRLEFSWPWEGQDLAFRIDLDIPTKGPMKNYARPTLTERGREQEAKRLMRVLVNHVKAKLIAVEEGLVDMEKEFLPYLLTQGDDTAGNVAIAELRAARVEGLLGLPKIELLKAGPAI